MKKVVPKCLIAMLMICLCQAITLGQDAQPEAAAATISAAEEVAEAAVSIELFTVNNVWMMVATFLVFIMHLGFATLEAGMTRAKNTVNILAKNVAIIAIGLLTYWFIGFNLMYPGEWIIPNVLGKFSFLLSAGNDASSITSEYNVGYTYWTDFLFQGMFAATAATIISGAVAERVKLNSFLIFSVIYVAIIYPIAGSWKWGGGFLQTAGFHDFAGSTLVHSVGGWGALMGAIILGARSGKYSNGKINAIPGHNMPLATIGVFLLWLGWFGFNGGSVLSADAGGTSFVLVTTCLAAAAGIAGAMLTSWFVQKKPDLSMMLNGSLAGLVGITAGADVVSINASVLIGLIAGILVVLSVFAIDKLKIDDPVGAISVHLVCGIWGTLAVGIFASGVDVSGDYIISFGAQIKGVLAYGVFCLITASILFYAIKVTMGLRVSKGEEQRGLDIGEHGMEAYSGFQIFTNQ